MAEHGPSEKARQAAIDAEPTFHIAGTGDSRHGVMHSAEEATDIVLRAAHDPALGLDRSVCLRDVVDVIEAAADEPGFYVAGSMAEYVRRAFTESSSPDREGAE